MLTFVLLPLLRLAPRHYTKQVFDEKACFLRDVVNSDPALPQVPSPVDALSVHFPGTVNKLCCFASVLCCGVGRYKCRHLWTGSARPGRSWPNRPIGGLPAFSNHVRVSDARSW